MALRIRASSGFAGKIGADIRGEILELKEMTESLSVFVDEVTRIGTEGRLKGQARVANMGRTSVLLSLYGLLTIGVVD